MLKQQGEMVIRLGFPNVRSGRIIAIICDYVTLSRPLLILITEGSSTDSDEEQEKCESLNV